MKIMVLAHGLRAAGGKVVGINTVKAIKNIDEDNSYLFILPDLPEYKALALESARYEVYYYSRRFGYVGRWFFDTYSLPRILRSYKPDVIWGMGNLGFAAPPCPQALLIHNPYLVYSTHHTGRLAVGDRLWLFFLRRALHRCLSKTELVICQTKTMADRLKRFFEYEGKIAITENVVSTFSAGRSGTSPDTLAPYTNKFKAFYLTRYYPHKGLEILVDMVDQYCDNFRDTIFVITIDPEQHPGARRLLKRIRLRKLNTIIVNVGSLKQEELGSYYEACDCLIMPTRIESFSGTYLESMHFGLPILTSDLDFAREVCGDAAFYFDPWDAVSIKDSVLLLKGNPERGRDLVARGKRRLSQNFQRSWGDIAVTIKDSLEDLVSQAGSSGGSPR